MKGFSHRGKFKVKGIVMLLAILFIGIVVGGGIRQSFVAKGRVNDSDDWVARDKQEEKSEILLSSKWKEEYIDMEKVTDAKFNNFKQVEKIEEEAVVDDAPEQLEDKPEEKVELPIEQPVVSGTRLKVGLISQLPDLYNGCEVTSLAMLLNYKGVGVSKMELADKMAKDSTAVVKDEQGKIISWGNPSVGFVGDVTGMDIGFSINAEPLLPLVNEYYFGGAINLTGGSLEDLKASIDRGNPVLVWINENFVMPIEYMSWLDSSGNEVWANINTHTVLLTGYDEGSFYYNDPLYSYKDAAISLQTFEAVWYEMGRKALSVN